MNKLVYSVFKAIMIAIVFVFVWDLVFYLYDVLSLNSRIETLAVSMKHSVSDNNGLTSEAADMYKTLLKQMGSAYNTSSYNFVVGFNLNSSSEAKDKNGNALSASSNLSITGKDNANHDVDLVHWNAGDIGDYGDITCLQIQVGVVQPLWYWGGNKNGDYNYNGEDATSWNRDVSGAGGHTITLDYTYFVPDLKYKSITEA